MRHLQIDRWSQRHSFLHHADARAKLLSLFVFLVSLTTTPVRSYGAFAAHGVLVLAALLASRLPAGQALIRAGAVLPFTFTFALVSWLAGDPARAEALVIKTYLCALAITILNGTTPLPRLTAALASLRVPRFLVSVIQFVYRYLFVLIEQSMQLRWAILARGGWRNAARDRSMFQAAAAALAALFQLSMIRAAQIHHSMLARGFNGAMPSLSGSRMRPADYLLVGAVAAAAAGLHWAT